LPRAREKEKAEEEEESLQHAEKEGGIRGGEDGDLPVALLSLARAAG
jgi:hypothetical protein